MEVARSPGRSQPPREPRMPIQVTSGIRMSRMASKHWLAIACLAAGLATAGAASGQEPPAPNPAKNNPHLGKRESIRSGMAMYRVRCADCHGLDAKGYRGPDLTALLAGDYPDERLFQTIRKGIPGTDMPGSQAADDELLLVIAYLRDISAVPATEAVTGNVDNGARIFAQQCGGCHRVAGRGGRLGPDLTRIGNARSRSALIREIRAPSEWMAPLYETVTLVTKD